MIKYYIIILLTILCGQEYQIDLPASERIITDSLVWKIVGVDLLNTGDESCNHIWVYSDVTNIGNLNCKVFHAGWHCYWDSKRKSRICSKCLRKEYMREYWYQHKHKEPITEYDMLNSMLKRSAW